MYSLIRHSSNKHQLAVNSAGELEPFLIASGKLAQRNTANTRLATITTLMGYYEIRFGDAHLLMKYECGEFCLYGLLSFDPSTQTIAVEGASVECMQLIYQLNQYPSLVTYIANMVPYPANGYEWADILHEVSGNALSETYILNYMGIKSNWSKGNAYFAYSTDHTTDRKGFCEAITSYIQCNGVKVGINSPRVAGDVTILPYESDVVCEWLKEKPEDCTDVIQGKHYYLRLYRYFNGRLTPLAYRDIPEIYRYAFRINMERQEGILEAYELSYFSQHSHRLTAYKDIFFNRPIYSIATALARTTHNPSYQMGLCHA